MNNDIVAEIAGIPIIETADIVSVDGYNLFLDLSYTIKDYDPSSAPTKQLYEATCKVDLISKKAQIIGKPLQVDNKQRIFKAYSPSRKWCLVALKRKFEDKTIPILEVYKDGVLTRTIKLGDVHGEFCSDATFGKVRWNEKLNLVSYLAEAKVLHEQKGYDRFEYKQSWGEKLSSRINPQIYLLNLLDEEELPKVIPCHEDYSPTCPCILPDGSVAFLGYNKATVKLGLTYCFNRPSELFLWDTNQKTIKLLYRSLEYSLRSLTCIGDTCYFLRSPLGKSHFNVSDLCSIDFNGGNPSILLSDIFTENIELYGEGKLSFMGIVKSTKKVFIFDPSDNKNTCIDEGELNLCDSILSSCFGITILKRSSPNSPQYLLFLQDGFISKIDATFCNNTKILSDIANLQYESIKISENADFVLIKPNNPNGRIILIPHGGPNSIYPVEFSIFSTTFAVCGYIVVAVNYTGSVGFSAEGISQLEGNIGSLDVDDCMICLEILETQLGIDTSSVYLVGGSHGGYISAMLTAKYPMRFKGCALRNPVTDLPSMSLATDIMDWTFGQMNLDFDLTKISSATMEQRTLQYEASPSLYVDSVVTPTLVLLGEKDLRVPPFLGKAWHLWLKGRGVKTKLLLFPDADHSLDTPTSENYSLRSILDFFNSL